MLERAVSVTQASLADARLDRPVHDQGHFWIVDTCKKTLLIQYNVYLSLHQTTIIIDDRDDTNKDGASSSGNRSSYGLIPGSSNHSHKLSWLWEFGLWMFLKPEVRSVEGS